MANDPKAPERMYVRSGVTMEEGKVTAVEIPTVPWSSKFEECFGPLYVRADLCASPLPPPGSEGEAEMTQRALAAFHGYNAEWSSEYHASMLDALRAALAPASGEARPHKESDRG